jgi:RNA polymerase sigma factor (sigma-70 family)
MADLRRLSTLTREREEEGWRDLVEANLAFVLSIASEFRDLGLPFEDLVNEGNVGLLKAAKRYEPERGYKFTTYAVWWIRKAILKALGEQTRVVRVPVYMLRQRKLLKASRETFSASNSTRRSWTCMPILKLTGHCGGQLAELPLSEISLDKKIGEDGDASLGDHLADPKNHNPEESLLRDEAQDLVEEAIDNLSAQQRTVIRYRFGLMGDRPLVLKQIGRRLGISRERVRQIEVQAKNRMRRYLVRRASIYPTSGVKMQGRDTLADTTTAPM